MSKFLTSLAVRAVGKSQALRPRIPTIFEPAAYAETLPELYAVSNRAQATPADDSPLPSPAPRRAPQVNPAEPSQRNAPAPAPQIRTEPAHISTIVDTQPIERQPFGQQETPRDTDTAALQARSPLRNDISEPQPGMPLTPSVETDPIRPQSTQARESRTENRETPAVRPNRAQSSQQDSVDFRQSNDENVSRRNIREPEGESDSALPQTSERPVLPPVRPPAERDELKQSPLAAALNANSGQSIRLRPPGQASFAQEAPAPTPTIFVSIGRIEVRAAPSATPQRPPRAVARPKNTQSLDDYLSLRSRGNR